jgi:hypothetical protein
MFFLKQKKREVEIAAKEAKILKLRQQHAQARLGDLETEYII